MEISPTIKNLFVRAASGAVLVASMVAALLYSHETGAIFLSLIAVLSTYEFLKMVEKPNLSLLKGYATFLALLFTVFAYFGITWAIFPFLLFRLAMELWRSSSSVISSVSLEFFALVYLVLPMVFLAKLDGDIVVALLVFVWSNDIGAYIIGISFGKHKMAKKISPKKSWEGFIGGFVITLIISQILCYYFRGNEFVWLLLGGVVSLSAVVGDLFESLIKREVGVKDSGNTIPGHGGFLDRFDSLFFAAPLYYILYIYLEKYIVLAQ